MLAALGTLILLLLVFTTGSKRRDSTEPPAAGTGTAFGRCPLCGSELGQGERVKSVLYPGGRDRMMDIHGCPHCYPPRPEVRRRCPVCKGELAGEEIVIARFFQVEGRRHVHVLGCSRCYRRRNA